MRQQQAVQGQIERALQWYERAALAGSTRAQYNLGLLYLRGEEIPWDGMKGLRWMRIAAKNGDKKARAVLRKLDPRLLNRLGDTSGR